MTSEYEKPMPRVTDLDRPHWEAAAKHQLLIQSCNDCGHMWFPPAENCPNCLGTNLGWKEPKGTGKVHSFIIYHQGWLPGYLKSTPYNVAIIQLDEGPRFISNVVGIDNDHIEVDMPVQVTFEDVAPDVSIPRFKPVGK